MKNLRMERVLSGRAPLFCASIGCMNTANELWGQDIALDDNGQARVAANGELVLTDGVETGVQDIKLRLFTRLGSLFYDLDFGSLIAQGLPAEIQKNQHVIDAYLGVVEDE